MSAFGLRSPSNIVPTCVLKVFPWIRILPSPIFLLAWQDMFGQNTSDEFNCSVVFSFMFIRLGKVQMDLTVSCNAIVSKPPPMG